MRRGRTPYLAILLALAGALGFGRLAWADGVALGGGTVGGSVLEFVRAFGPPDLVQTSDAGHEWHWYDAKGVDRDVLVDDALSIKEILISRPAPVNGKSAPLVQPNELPLLGAPIEAAAAALAARGATELHEANPTTRAWNFGGGVIVAELADGAVRGLLALDVADAQRRGYVAGGPPPPAYRAPRFKHVASVGYPRQAIDEGARGVVIVRVDLDVNGRPVRVAVLVSSGNRDLDDAEIASMKESTFTPASCSGKPCAASLMDREEFIP